MPKRFLTIWFPFLKTDWLTLRRPALSTIPFVLACQQRGRMMITAANPLAAKKGILPGEVVADARAIYPDLQVIEDREDLSLKLLVVLAKYCIRYTPFAAVDLPDGLVLDISGCAHLWGGEKEYLAVINKRFQELGYSNRIGIADTAGASWAITRFAKALSIIEPEQQQSALLDLPPAALRLSPEILQRLNKLGLQTIRSFMTMPRSNLRRRFGQELISNLDRVLGYEMESMHPVQPTELFQERLPCLEPIITETGIRIALESLLEALCVRLQKEEKGLRTAIFKGYRMDGVIEKIDIGTNRPSHHPRHLFKLFENKIALIEPALGIELFTLDGLQIEELSSIQENIWHANCGLEDVHFSELIDRVAGKIGNKAIHRYLPDQHYWPERSVRLAASLYEDLAISWPTDKLRPVQLLCRPEAIEVTAPVPDYPPMLFRYKNILHKIKKADGPERIEQEWWLEEGQHRDYYAIEDEEGRRYWVFRAGHYSEEKSYKWFMHGFFA